MIDILQSLLTKAAIWTMPGSLWYLLTMLSPYGSESGQSELNRLSSAHIGLEVCNLARSLQAVGFPPALLQKQPVNGPPAGRRGQENRAANPRELCDELGGAHVAHTLGGHCATHVVHPCVGGSVPSQPVHTGVVQPTCP